MTVPQMRDCFNLPIGNGPLLERAPAMAQVLRELVTAAAVLAKGVVSVIEGARLRTPRAAALELINGAGRAIGAEPRRRHCHAVRSAPVSFVC